MHSPRPHAHTHTPTIRSRHELAASLTFPPSPTSPGKPDAVSKAVKSYRVYANKSKIGDKPGEYLIDHSIMFYLMDDK